MFFRPHAGGADSALAMGDTGRSNFGLDPVTAQVGSHLLSSGSSLVSERLGRGWASVDSLRYYFAVSNSYVQNKLRLVLFPFLRRDWARLVVAQSSDQEAYRPPRDDLNAPDLYIPLMAFVTWIIVSSIALATQTSFSPEAFGKLASRGFAVVFLEVLLLKGGFYMLSDAPAPPLLVLVAWSGYKFVGSCLNMLAFLTLGTTMCYLVLMYNAAASAFVIREQQRVAWLSTASSPSAGKLFRLGMMVSQLVWALVLARSV